MYKRFLDNIFMIWSGSSTALYDFRTNLNPAIKSVITLEWQGMPSAGGAADLAVFDRDKHSGVVSRPRYKSREYYHNGGFRVWHTQARLRVSPVRPISLSFKTRLSWMAQSRNARAARTLRLEECRKFYGHLRARGYSGRPSKISELEMF